MVVQVGDQLVQDGSDNRRAEGVEVIEEGGVAVTGDDPL